MGFLRGIGRAAPLLAAGLAAGWYLRRQGLLGGQPQAELPWPPEPAPAPSAPPVAAETKMAEVVEAPPEEPPPPVAAETKMAEVVEAPPEEPEPPEPSEPPMEAHAEAVEDVSDASDVTSVVEDLLSGPPGDEIVDAEVVDDDPGDLDERVSVALAEIPGLLPGSVNVESYRGAVWLRGELESLETIDEVERRVTSVPGVTEVRNLLHLPGTPPPAG